MIYSIINRSEKVFLKDISNIPRKQLENIFQKLEELAENGLGNNTQIKKLNNYNLCDYRLRVGNYRILFNIDYENNKIIVFRVLHRSKLY